MIVMPTSVTSPEVRSLMAKYPNMLGNLFSPGDWKTPYALYALDNGRFANRGANWSEREYLKLLDSAARHSIIARAPAWVVCPDVVADWKETLREWDRWQKRLRATGWPVAIAVQDGACVADVRALHPNVVFVGGSTRWKISTAAMWCREFPHVHIARVNSVARARACWRLGAASVDGTGWMRTDRQRRGLRAILAEMAGHTPTPLMLWREDADNDL